MRLDWDWLESSGALISTVLTAIGIKLIDKIISKRSEKISDTNETRAENSALRHENRALEAEIDLWKEKYYDKVERSLFPSHSSGSL